MVPVAIHGSASVGRWKKLTFPKVTVQFGEPITFPVAADPTREQQMEAATEVFDVVRRMYTDLEKRGRKAVRRSLREGCPDGSARGRRATRRLRRTLPGLLVLPGAFS